MATKAVARNRTSLFRIPNARPTLNATRAPDAPSNHGGKSGMGWTANHATATALTPFAASASPNIRFRPELLLFMHESWIVRVYRNCMSGGVEAEGQSPWQ